MGKLINRIPGSCLLISTLPGSASRRHVESLGKPRNSTSPLEALPGKLDSLYRGCLHNLKTVVPVCS